jgi:hypothetical protein
MMDEQSMDTIAAIAQWMENGKKTQENEGNKVEQARYLHGCLDGKWVEHLYNLISKVTGLSHFFNSFKATHHCRPGSHLSLRTCGVILRVLQHHQVTNAGASKSVLVKVWNDLKIFKTGGDGGDGGDGNRGKHERQEKAFKQDRP